MILININTIIINNISISSQLQSYCDSICHHELYVEYLTSIIKHYEAFFYLNKLIFVHSLFGLIHRILIANHLFVESLYTMRNNLLK
ncbi:unnamed protein product [Rotaria sp. Silwood2]|nr:unnamed protein product [Rotaria sp. Silwood2]CAF4751774.1 unnamed protein product [Rotaria sp. Silwood2]